MPTSCHKGRRSWSGLGTVPLEEEAVGAGSCTSAPAPSAAGATGCRRAVHGARLNWALVLQLLSMVQHRWAIPDSVRRTLNSLKPRRLASLADRLRSCGPQFLHALSTSGSSSQDLSHQPQVAQQKVKAHGHCGNGSSRWSRDSNTSHPASAATVLE